MMRDTLMHGWLLDRKALIFFMFIEQLLCHGHCIEAVEPEIRHGSALK